MARIDIMACKTKDDYDEVRCGYHDCRTAYEAVMLEIDGQFPDTRDMEIVSAYDEEMNVSALKVGEGRYEIHIYVENSDWYFEYEVPEK